MHFSYRQKLQSPKRNRSQYFSTNIRALLIVFSYTLILGLMGCQSLNTKSSSYSTEQKTINYGQYYMLLSDFNETQLATEISYQKSIFIDAKNTDYNDILEWQLKSVILYSLPLSPIHNPFTAKSKLNSLALENLKSQEISATDFSFFRMLKSQLNQQVLLLNKLTIEKKSYQQQLLEFQHLQQQLLQLKKIEKNINDHGQ